MSLKYLKDKHKNSLSGLLQKYKKMFDGTEGWYTGSNYTIESKEDTKPFPNTTNHQREVNRLIKIGVLMKINNSQWAASTFIIPKINGKVRFISDFRELNNQ